MALLKMPKEPARHVAIYWKQLVHFQNTQPCARRKKRHTPIF